MSDLTRQYPGNSEEDRSKAKQIEKVASGHIRPESAGRKLTKAMVSEDAKSVGNYVLWDILIPAIKEMVSNAVSSGIERALFGESYRGSSRNRTYTSYSGRGGSRRPHTPYRSSEPRRERERDDTPDDIRDVIIESRQEAYEVIDRLRDVASNYDIATLGDLYGLVGISSKYTDEDWGWGPDELRDCGVRKVREGFVLEIPDPSYLKGRD